MYKRQAETYHQKGIKLDVIVCDFFHWPRMGDFRFDEEFFPDPEEMVKRLEELGAVSYTHLDVYKRQGKIHT